MSVADLRSAIMKMRKEVMPPVSKMKKNDLKETFEKMTALKHKPEPVVEKKIRPIQKVAISPAKVEVIEKKGRPEKGSEEAKKRMADIRAKKGKKEDK
jgi:hypothetical protein